MEKKRLTLKTLAQSAREFCAQESMRPRAEFYGVTDGKAIGTLVEHLFQSYLKERYTMNVGNSGQGLDLPSINTDIKVTSISHPQSSCPYRDSKQKIYGLGYNLIIFAYQKHDDAATQMGMLDYRACSIIKAERTGDYQTTKGLRDIISNNGNVDDIFAFLNDRGIPGDEVTLYNLAQQIMQQPPEIGYLTISNALQWRLSYNRIVALEQPVKGIVSIIKNDGD